MFKKMFFVACVVMMAFATTACIWFLKNGDQLIVKNETSCWQCPKGNNLSRWDKIYNCANQRNFGSIAESDVIIADSGDSFTPIQSGFVRASASVFAVNPYTSEKIDLGQKTCWIDLADLKKK